MSDINKELDTAVNDVEAVNKENEAVYLKALDKVNSYGLDWTFRSVQYVINKENISFGQLRSCIYMTDGGPTFDYIKSTLNIVKAGLVGSKQIDEKETEKLNNKAYDIIEDWRAEFGFIGTLHLVLINQMETKHFFMGTPDLAVINHLNFKNLQRDLGENLIREDLEEKVKQAQALSTIF